MRVPVLAYSFLLKEGSTGRGARALQRQEQPDTNRFPVKSSLTPRYLLCPHQASLLQTLEGEAAQEEKQLKTVY